MYLESFGMSQGYKTGEKIAMWVDLTRWEIWRERIRLRQWDVPTRKQVLYEVTATYTL
jgi:hypothetical protein